MSGYTSIYQPDSIIVERSALELPYTKKLLNLFADVPIELVEEIHDIKRYGSSEIQSNVFLITNYKGNLIKKCPGSQGVLCCNYYVANLINGCPYSCKYCILQDYLNCGCVMICTNIDQFFAELEEKMAPDQILRLGTGELADSLAFDSIVNLTDELIPRMKNYPNLILELKTKSTCIDNVLKYQGSDQVIIAWSLNPQTVIDRFELDCTALEDRLTAAEQVIEHGYPVAFHFDPIILIDNWEHHYHAVVDTLFSRVPADRIRWISLGGLRFMPSLKRMSLNRFRHNEMFAYGEFAMCKDGKYRYFKPLRVNMYRSMLQRIRQYSNTVPVYMCMETREVWQEVFSSQPHDMQSLDLLYKPYHCRKQL